ncbi:MAG: nucleotidyl transferase AbiEii/AbiGii toxin family protein [Desulfuromusa sp.]|nr:nucleotidyl transferase AbiEii/AbiGii toxin family protein [Desulfuromusa sp.]
MIEIIQQRLDSYQAQTLLQEDQALKEILQEISLYGLWRAGFFDVAAFQGGTSLRILYKLPRFSEDLDFILKEANSNFTWQKYLDQLIETFTESGLKIDVLDKSRMDKRVQQAILKNDAIANQLTISFPQKDHRVALKIKLEIDIHPPAESAYGWSYLDFPLDFEVCHQDLSSNFALKIHALLCRPYLKGRDWFDFCWYVSRKVQPNYRHLQAALYQYGPWEKQEQMVDCDWLQRHLLAKIDGIDWQKAVLDVERFLDSSQRRSLSLWDKKFFTHKVSLMT